MVCEGNALFFKGGKAWDLVKKIPVEVVGKNEDKVLGLCQEPNGVIGCLAINSGVTQSGGIADRVSLNGGGPNRRDEKDGAHG